MVAFIVSVVVCFILYHVFDSLKYSSYVILEWIGILSCYACIIVPIVYLYSWIMEDKKPKIQNVRNSQYEYILDAVRDNDITNSNDEHLDSEENHYDYGTSNNYFDAVESSYNERTPMRVPCRACNNSGSCPVCHGSGRGPIGINYYASPHEIIEGDCKSCNGSGRCSGCGGDGYLDEGIDF